MTERRYPSRTIEAITRFLFLSTPEDELVPADFAIVLGSDCIDETCAVLADLFRRGILLPTSTVVLSGATGELTAGGDLECNRLFDCAAGKYHLPETVFVKDPDAANAYENVRNSREIYDRLGGEERFRSCLCIGKSFLMRRASMYAAKFGFAEEMMQYVGVVERNERNIGPETWWKNEAAVARVMAEIERIGRYALKGDLNIR